jgi:hypothetical protein
MASSASTRTQQIQQTTTLGVDFVSSQTVSYSYSTPPGNQPATYGDRVFLWQSSSLSVPVDREPLVSQAVPTNTPAGSAVIMGLDITTQSYLLAYAVGGRVQNAAALAFIPGEGGGDVATFEPAVTVVEMAPGHVVYEFSVPQGTTPATDGDWVGLWETSQTGQLYTTSPLAAAAVSVNMSSGTGVISTLVRPGTVYTLGYFKGGYDGTRRAQTTLACTTTFG